jgi:hydrocephalus-inducing protein
VSLLPTYVTKTSQRTFKVINSSEHTISYAVKAHATHEAELAAALYKLEELEGAQSDSAVHSTSTYRGAATEEEGAEGGHGAAGGQEGGEHGSDDEDAILAQRTIKQHQQYKATRRTITLDRQLFGDKNFRCVPSEGQVPPHSEVEVVVQFTPDYAREYEVVAYVDLQGLTPRLPLTLRAKGLVSNWLISLAVHPC